MSALEELNQVASGVENPYLEEWTAQGKKAVGFLCSHVPEEILHAADVLPYRLRAPGCTDTASADVYMGHVNCTFVRSCLEYIFAGRFDFLDGFVFTRNYRHDPLGDSSSHLDGFQLGEFEVTTGDLQISFNYFDEIPDGIGVTDLVFATNFSEMHIDIIGNYIAEHGWYTLRAHNAATFTVTDNTVASGVNWVALLNSPGPHHFACNFFDDGSPITAQHIAGGDGPGVTYGECG